MVKQPNVTIDLREINHTELVALCHWVGIKASRGWPRVYLIWALENFEPIVYKDPIDKLRESLSAWLQRYWDRIQMQAQKKVCPYCENCTDLQVLTCYMKNRKGIEGR